MNSRRPNRLAELSRAVLRRKLMIVVPALVLTGSSIIALSKMPNRYQSSARLLAAGSIDDSTFKLADHLGELRQLITARETLEAVVRKHEPKQEPLDEQVSAARKRIVVEYDSSRSAQQGVVTVSYTATDPRTAQACASELANQLVTRTAKDSSPQASSLEPLRMRVDELSKRLRKLEENDPSLIGGTAERGLVSSAQPARSSQPSPEAIRAQQMNIESVKDQQYRIQQQLADVDRRLASQRQLVDQQRKGASLRDNPTYAILISRRTELQGQRDTLINRQDLTDRHPRVAAINDQITAINRQIEELRQQDGALASQSQEARELASLESEHNRPRLIWR